jgi:hypothetical protein
MNSLTQSIFVCSLFQYKLESDFAQPFNECPMIIIGRETQDGNAIK